MSISLINKEIDRFWAMENAAYHLWIAFALVFVVEGLIYAVFPAQVQKMMRAALQFDSDSLRYFGVAMVALGVLSVWLLLKV